MSEDKKSVREAVVDLYKEGALRVAVHRVLLKDLLDQHAEGARFVAGNHAMQNREGCWDGAKLGEDPCWACQFWIHKRGVLE